MQQVHLPLHEHSIKRYNKDYSKENAITAHFMILILFAKFEAVICVVLLLETTLESEIMQDYKYIVCYVFIKFFFIILSYPDKG